MNVMYATDSNYVEIMGVSILSLLETNKAVEEINIYIVEDNVSDKEKQKVIDMISEYGRSVQFIPKPDLRSILGVDIKTLRWSDSAYSRLFLKELFGDKTKLDKLLYLDCDTLILDSLQKLWDTDISDYLGAACLECMSNMHKYIIGAHKKDKYINTGMLLINVKKWIEKDVQSVCVDFIRKHKGKTEYVDQGVINGTVSNYFKIVNPRYNLTSLAYDFTYEEMRIYRKPEFGYSKKTWEKAIARPAVVHFTTSFLSIRPWFENSKHPYAKLWKQYHDETSWKDNPYRKLKNRSVRDWKENLYRKLPRRFTVKIAGFFHSYVKPLVYVMR
ncbi:MAG: glycosyltransferase family 8 protein [Clostridium sp.]|nr:glycosyltransferase family 8 protein [Clostridium sp.]